MTTDQHSSVSASSKYSRKTFGTTSVSPSDIEKIRRFQRAVTTEVGALDASFLGRGRPLGPARVINAIGNGITEVANIRDYLKLDSGLMSRLLRSLEEEGMVNVTPSEADSRRRCAHLTALGKEEYIAYESLSNQRIQALLEKHAHPEKLVAAMALIATALGREQFEFKAVDPADVEAQRCMHAYYDELAACFPQGFDVSLSCDPDQADMRPPKGSFVLGFSDGCPIACGGLKGTNKGYAEIKRIWVAPEARGLGVIHSLMNVLEETAKSLGYSKLRLDTNSVLIKAVSFYRKHGWHEIDRFNDDPYPDLFFEKIIAPSTE
ncbi:hypothetical protein LMG33818_002237 [Halomonadaceae bacterium LMG 33818]|uniref:bifunctional helix-turn-helix transcriptional regulator/GNAT family N-acetyltransferase n=1 Tax=Cernens ardua TaxID=3402176 RepID=UPI003EDC6A8E